MKKSAFPATPVPRQHRSNVLPLKGEIDLHVSPAVTQSLNAMTEKKPERIVIDLSRATYIDSAGLAALILAMQNPPISKQKQFSCLLTCGDPHSRCGGKRHRFGVARVHRQRRRHPGICEQIGDHSPLGHTVVPVQCVHGNLAALPHFF